MAFEALTDRFSSIIKKLKGETYLTEKNMEEMLKSIRLALLEADVNYKVVKEFINNVKEKAVGQEVYKKVNPSQMITKIVHDELETLLGSDQSEIKYPSTRPLVVMLCGLQGTGKTTTAGKLAKYFQEKLHKKTLLAACDVYRPAAIDQLKQIASQVHADFFSLGKEDPVKIASKAKEKTFNEHYDALILDTAGRLQIDAPLMEELSKIKADVKPDEILLLVDAASGQDAINVALAFNEQLGLTGCIMSKLDGDARGGASLSIRHLTNVPIKFVGVGEKLSDLDAFHPDRMADRILGMGDVVTLVEKVQDELDEKAMEKEARKMMSGSFTLDDMLHQMKQFKRLGSLTSLLKFIPGMPSITDEQKAKAETEMKNFEVIINSMTKEERLHPEILKNSRKVRIAKGSGKTNMDINRVLKKYEQMKEITKRMNAYKKSGGRGLPPGMNFPGMM
ncbi:MAG: signal recognition particle protein [Bacilli bacterium]|nr:signal recognition particle protein [Bacilli bacterium]